MWFRSCGGTTGPLIVLRSRGSPIFLPTKGAAPDRAGSRESFVDSL
jgi:hypothetical protein